MYDEIMSYLFMYDEIMSYNILSLLLLVATAVLCHLIITQRTSNSLIDQSGR